MVGPSLIVDLGPKLIGLMIAQGNRRQEEGQRLTTDLLKSQILNLEFQTNPKFQAPNHKQMKKLRVQIQTSSQTVLEIF